MKVHTVIVSYNRLELLQRTVESYLDTVEPRYSSAEIIDNGSSEPTKSWLRAQSMLPVHYLGANYFPGMATNIGFARAPSGATFLHRSDSDMEYLPGWCAAVREAFGDWLVGQVGLRTDEEELHCEVNVGGTAVFRRQLWQDGIRYRIDSWADLGAHTEDYWISQSLVQHGWRWARVKRPCVVHLASGDLNDPYYQHSYGIRGIA